MKPVHYFLIVVILVLLNNTISVMRDKNIFDDFIDLKSDEVIELSEIKINEVFSNSFFFVSVKPLKISDTTQIFRLDSKKSRDLIYFKVNTIKFKDSLFFFQHIDWISKRSRKINEGFYTLNKIVINEK
jgi:hypothetical protein